jgi:hypothetical protein
MISWERVRGGAAERLVVVDWGSTRLEDEWLREGGGWLRWRLGGSVTVTRGAAPDGGREEEAGKGREGGGGRGGREEDEEEEAAVGLINHGLRVK